MHSEYFPACQVHGPIDPPVPFSHMISSGAVPKKCSTCKNLFEGSCTRYMELTGHYMHLDYGPCNNDGPTDPVLYEDKFLRSKVEIPRKCSRCPFLRIDFGFYCNKDADKWGDFHRGLDWGNWQPDVIYIALPPPKVTNKTLCKFAKNGEVTNFIKEHHRINPGISMAESKNDFEFIRSRILRLTKELS